MLLSKSILNKTPCHMATVNSHVHLSEKLWDLAEKLHMTPEELRNIGWL
jgi:hypothetical protein